MDCLESFTINIRGNNLLGVPPIQNWSDPSGIRYFSLDTIGNLSRYNIEGFKNINIYGVDVIGSVQHHVPSAAFGALITDWSFQIELAGTLPLVSGTVQGAPNYWNIIANGTEPKIYRLSKNTNSVKLASPIQSVKYIEFQGLFCQGQGVENVNAIEFEWHFDFIFYYKYEGE